MADLRTLLHEAAPRPECPFEIERLLVRRPARRRLVVWVFGLLAVVGAGVPIRSVLVSPGGDSEPVEMLPSPEGRVEEDPALPCARVGGSAGRVASGDGPLRATQLAELPLDGPLSPSLALWDDYLAYEAEGGFVAVCNLRTGKVLRVDPVLDRGEIVALTGAGSVLAYTEWIGSTVPGAIPGDAGRTWRVAVADVESGRTREVYRRAREEAEYPQFVLPQTDGRWVSWVQESEVVIHDSKSGATRVEQYPDVGQVALVDGTLYFDGSHDGKRTVFQVPADGSRAPEPVPGTSRASRVRAVEGRLAWQVGSGNRTAEVWVLDIGVSGAVPVHVGDGNEIRLGDGFVVFDSDDGLYVHDGAARSAALRLGEATGSVPWAGAAAGGDRVTWLDTEKVSPDTPPTLRVVRVSR